MAIVAAGRADRASRHRFTLDLDDEVRLSFPVDEYRSIRLRYEPWILPVDLARRKGETLCRAGASGPAWAPDVLIEFIDRSDTVDGASETIYAVVVDAKYSKDIHDHHWSRVTKYAEIRSVRSQRQVVRQVWLAHPGESDAIRCRDAAVTWTDRGPDRPRDETIMGVLGLRPGLTSGEEALSEEPTSSVAAREFALGLIRYMRFLPAEGPGTEEKSGRQSAAAQSSAAVG